MATTPIGRLLLEAMVVGAAFVVIAAVIHVFAMRVAGAAAMTDHRLLAAQVAFAAALFHVICEYTTLNELYCRARPEAAAKK